MVGELIKICITYESQINETINVERNKKLRDVLFEFFCRTRINFRYYNILINGDGINDNDFKRPISSFVNHLNGDLVNILIYELDPSNSSNFSSNNKVKVIFHFRKDIVTFDFHDRDNTRFICKIFTLHKNIQNDSLIFKYKDDELDFSKNLYDTIGREYINNNEMNIYVEEKGFCNQLFNGDFCKNNKQSLIITSFIILAILIIFIALIPTVFLRKEDKKSEKETGKEDNGEYSEICKYELFKGECITFAFSVTYKVDYEDEKIQLFNKDIKYNIFAMKIGEEIIEPISEFNFNLKENNIVYYYFLQKNTISFSYMFENIDKLIRISFNNNYFNNYYITDMSGMFSGCTSLKEIYFEEFQGQYVTDISYLFSNCINLVYINFSKFNPKELKYMNNLFYNCESIYNIDISNLNSMNAINMSSMFYNCISLQSLVISNFYSEKLLDISYMFYNCDLLQILNITNFNTKNVMNMSYMFAFCKSLKSLDLSNLNCQNINNMESMFFGCNSLEVLYLPIISTGNTIKMEKIFYGCESLISLFLSNIHTINVDNMNSMFYKCESLSTLDLSNFNTQNVKDMSYMFYNCKSLTSINLSNFKTQNVITMERMFYGCESLKYLSLSNFNTENVNNMEWMFSNTKSLTSLDLSNFFTPNIINLYGIFFGCESLKYLDISNFVIEDDT